MSLGLDSPFFPLPFSPQAPHCALGKLLTCGADFHTVQGDQVDGGGAVLNL